MHSEEAASGRFCRCFCKKQGRNTKNGDKMEKKEQNPSLANTFMDMVFRYIKRKRVYSTNSEVYPYLFLYNKWKKGER